MRAIIPMLLLGLIGCFLFFIWYAPELHRLQADIQAYQTRSLLPDLPENTKQGLGE